MTADYGATVLLIGCVALLFYFIPNTEMRFRWVWPGAISPGCCGAARSRRSPGTRATSRPGMPCTARSPPSWCFSFWVYISAVILLYGVEMTAAYARLQSAARRHPEVTRVSPPVELDSTQLAPWATTAQQSSSSRS